MEPFYWKEEIYDLYWSDDQYWNKLKEAYACSI